VSNEDENIRIWRPHTGEEKRNSSPWIVIRKGSQSCSLHECVERIMGSPMMNKVLVLLNDKHTEVPSNTPRPNFLGAEV
jgi:hypothetical protein